ncbi:MAG TPA: LysM peptidoglycan-binding domain-containing protein [Rhabdochlamydiaceae bacterium]|jgi:LysM repeat protein
MTHTYQRMLIFLFAVIAHFSLEARALHSDALLDELRLELSDIKHELHSARIEINLLEEKIAKQERSKNAHAQDKAQLHSGEQKIAALEKLLDKIVSDVRTLSAQNAKIATKIQDLEIALAAQDKKYDDVAKLKGTLSSISKAIGQQPSSGNTRIYIVKAGDSLEKIARAHHTTVDALKQLNHLTHDKIIIGQELKLADEPR